MPIKYTVRTKAPLSDYTVVGDSLAMTLRHPEIGSTGQVPVLPSYIYYLQRSAQNVVPEGPAEMILIISLIGKYPAEVLSG